MSVFVNLCRFLPQAGGLGDFVYSSAVPGCQSPTAAGAINGASYKCYAVSADLTQWELFQGNYNSATNTFPRTLVLANSSGTGTSPGQSGAGTKINFLSIPQVAVVAAAEDLLSYGGVNNPFTGNMTVGGTFGVTGNASIGGTFAVTGASTFTTIHGTGAATFDTTLAVTGIATFTVAPVFTDKIGSANALNAVSYGAAQSLTGPQLIQARSNIAAVGVVKNQKFVANGTYTPSTGMLYCIIECWGGGGAGGGAASSAGNQCSGGGGGAGSYSRLVASAATIGASKAVTIGAGGTGASNAAGNPGGDTSVGVLCIGKGGSGGGAAGGVSSVGGAGPGGPAGTGDDTSVGACGLWGQGLNTVNFSALSGAGGATSRGGNGASISGTGTGNAATANSGSGGGGGESANVATAVSGGAGGSGYVSITEFCNQ